MALAAAVAMVAGTVMSAQAQKQQAKDQAKWMKYNAAVSESQAKQERISAAYEAGQKRKEGRRLRARQLALYGKAGVSPQVGSPLQKMQETAIEVERDARLIEIGGRQRGTYLESQAGLQRAQASATKRAGRTAFATTLIGGLGSAGLQYASYSQYKLPSAGAGWSNTAKATILRY